METAVTAVVNDIAQSIDDGHLCALVLLDLSAAFDTTDHKIFIDIMEKRFAVHDTALSWFNSQLEQRTQFYCVGTEISTSIWLKYGVPQGSVAGPVEFICYTEELEETISMFSVRHHFYADDAQLMAHTTLRTIEPANKKSRSVLHLSTCGAVPEDYSSTQTKRN